MPRSAVAALLVLSALPAAAGSISGQVIDKANGLPISGMTVRLWSPVYVADPTPRIKSWFVSAATTTTPGYSFGGLSGPYLVDTLPGGGLAFEYTDRWYAPNEATDDLAGFVSATQLDGNLDNGSVNIYVLRGGGVDGTIVDSGGNLLPGVFLRAELAGTPAIHHNDISQGGSYHPEHPGEFSFRNLPALGTYQILTYWQPGNWESQVWSPVSVSSGSDTTGVGLALATPTPADPWSGSHTITLTGAAHAKQFTSSGAIIAPMNAGDFDEFCIAAAAGDRFSLSAKADALVNSARINPFVDPILRFSGPGLPLTGFKTYDDDSGGGLDALIADTGEVPGGTYCARVSTYGDSSFTGTTQGSTGRVVFHAALLNRRPTITATVVPPPPPGFVEGGVVTVNLAYQDADGDSLTPAATLVDASNTPDTTGSIGSITGSGAVFTWTIPQGASTRDPFVATFTVTDSFGDAYSTSKPATATIAINAVAVPQQVAPADGERMPTATPSLEIQDLVDSSQTNVSYEFDLHDHTDAGMPQSGTAPAGAGGHTTFVPLPLPEDEYVNWRVRALHGSATSAWTGFRGFRVDAVNEPPPDPVLVKPSEGDEVLVRQPGFSATSQPDPDADAVSLIFELSSDKAFGTLVEQSDPIPVTLANTTTPWTPSHPLSWGGSYWARVYAVDARGAHSGYSGAVGFTVRPDLTPAAPKIQGDFAAQCQGVVFHQAPPTIALGDVQDPDGEPVTLELQLLDFAADPASAAPLLDVTQAQGAFGDTTAMDTSAMKWTEDAHYRVRARAGDGTLWTAWTECDFTLDQVPSLSDGGAPPADGGPGSDAGSQTPPDGVHRSGCTTAGASGPALLLLAALALLRRRRQ